jgi:hypothetical protein
MSILGIQQKAPDTSKQQAQVAANTGQAASDVFVQAIEAVPFPANLAAAPAASALVQAEMAPFAAEASGAIGSAAGGAFLDKDMLVQAHAKELILPAQISTGLRGMIDGGRYGVPNPAASSVAIDKSSGGNNYGGDTYHLHHTGPDALSVLQKHMVPMIQEAKRRGRIRDGE